MNKILIILGVVLLAGAGWYVWTMSSAIGQPSENGESMMEENMEQPMEEASQVVISLAEQNDSGESGTATITETDEGVHVVLELTGAPAGVEQPAHIHTNSCANIGGVEYPLTFPTDGYSETTLNVSMEELEAGLPLSINVHKSVEEVSVYVACGDIVF